MTKLTNYRRDGGRRWTDKLGTTLIIQIRANRASTRWCKTEERYFLFFLREDRRLVRVLAELGRTDLEIRINNSTFSLDLHCFQTVCMNTSHVHFIFSGWILHLRKLRLKGEVVYPGSPVGIRLQIL